MAYTESPAPVTVDGSFVSQAGAVCHCMRSHAHGTFQVTMLVRQQILVHTLTQTCCVLTSAQAADQVHFAATSKMTIPKTIIALKWMAHELHHGKQMTMDGCLDAMQLFV